MIVEAWSEGNELRDAVIVDGDHGSERIPIAPDAFVVLRLLNEPEGRIASTFFSRLTAAR